MSSEKCLDAEAKRLGVTLDGRMTVSGQFASLISGVIAEHDRRAKAKDPKVSVEQVVLLVDEYDACPLTGFSAVTAALTSISSSSLRWSSSRNGRVRMRHVR